MVYCRAAQHTRDSVMITAKLLRDEGILVVSPEGKLESTDFERLRLLADPYI
jgi:hypothetical protein